MHQQHTLLPAADRTQQVEEYYFSIKLQEIAEMRKKGIDVINLGIGSPDLPPHPSVVKALQETALRDASHGYQSYKGTDALRKAFAGWYQRYFGVDLNPDNEILPLMGSKEGIMQVSLAFLNPGDKVLIPDPGYPTYTSVAKMLGAEPVFYPLRYENAWKPDLKKLSETDLSRVKLMWVNYPHMPSGAKADMAFFTSLADFARQHRILLVNDNPYAFIQNPAPLSLLSVPGSIDVAMELNSLSKSHNMPGWRIGMLAGNREYVGQALKMKSNMDSGMFLAMQDAAVAALGLGQEWYDALNEVYSERKVIVHQIFDALGCKYETGQAGLFVWARGGDEGVDVKKMADDILYTKGVFITPGFIFGENGKRYLRISLCTPKERLNEALQRIVNH